MADKKISQLTGASTPLAGTEVLPIVQSGATVKVAVSDLTAARAVSALSLALTSTDASAAAAPLLELYRDSASPAASDTLGEIEFNGEDSAGNKQAYGLIHASILSPTSTAEQGQIHFETATAGALTEKMIIGTTNLVINEIGAVYNVRIESDGDANLFYTDGTNNRIGVGTASPSTKLDVQGTGTVVARARSLDTTGSTIGGVAAEFAGGSSLAMYAGSNYTLLVSAGATDPLIIGTANAEKMRLTSGGDVGIGTSSPDAQLTVNTIASFGAGAGATPSIAAKGDLNTGVWFPAADTIAASTGGSERIRITSAGNFLVNATSVPTNGAILHSGVAISAATGYTVKPGQSGALGGNVFNIDWTGSPQLWIDATNLGTITVVSDYRIKKNIATQTTSALDRVMQLRPVNYEIADYGTLFKADGVVREGFIAHELAEIIPSAVNGEKDTENQIQSLKLDALCSVLTKAIQEQQDLIQSLTTRLSALEGN